MNGPSKFDKEVKKKMLMLEDEPSAAVWAGIRAETGLALQPEQGLWAYRIMAAASVAFLIAMAVFLGRTQKTGSDQIASQTETVGTPERRPSTQPQPFAEDPGRKIPVSEEKLPWYGSPDIAVENILAEQEDVPAPLHEPELQPLQQPKELFVDQQPIPEALPDKETPAPSPLDRDQKDKVFADNSAPQPALRQGNKRIIRLPRAEDFSKDNIRKRSRGLLGTLASNAKDRLGIDTKFKQKEDENLRTTAFSANLGFFKVKKVRTVKTDKK